MSEHLDMNRRKLLALCGGLAGAAVLADVTNAQSKGGTARAPTAVREAAVPAAGARKFFSADEFRLLDELAEMIIPADAQSGGARAAKVAEFIDARLGESIDTEMRQSWRDDLAEINRLSFGISGRSFVAGSTAERSKVLERVSRNEKNPREPGEIAFGSIKWQVAFVYYKTQIGIHDELKYMGNQILDEFIGIDQTKL